MATVKLKAGGYLVPVDVEDDGDNWRLTFRYNPTLLAEVKAMDGARWNPNNKTWTVKRSNRNKFTLQYLMGKPVFEPYEKPLIPVTPRRPMPCGHGMHPKKPCPTCGCKFCLGEHQVTMIAHALTRRRCIIAGKPGTGKTLVYIEVLEATEHEIDPKTGQEYGDIPYYVSTESGLLTLRTELVDHHSRIQPRAVTFDGLKRLVSTWPAGTPPPRRIIVDECQKCKGHKTQRSEVMLYLANEMESYWKGAELIIEGSGTPDPKEPVDWWMQAEIARPGYLRESSWFAERKRLAIIEERQGMSGYYPHLVQWKDGKECETCKRKTAEREAQLKEMQADGSGLPHQLEEILLTHHDAEHCEYCHGTNHVPDEVSLFSKRLDGLVLAVAKPKDLPEKQYRVIQVEPTPDTLRAAEIVAMTSENGLDALGRLRQLSDGFLYDENHQPKYAHSPKLDVVRQLLDEYEDQQRLIIYAAYTASIDMLKRFCAEQGWLVWKYDGKSCETWDGRSLDEAYRTFQDESYNHKIAYVAHPQKGGVSLTLTSAVAAVFYSNDFQGEAREQAEDRIHRIGMDLNKGATIIDILHLGTDRLVLDNLMDKRDMSKLTIAHIKDALHRR